MLERYLKDKLEGKKTLILGFGREGKSTYGLIRKILPQKKLYIADSNAEIDRPNDALCQIIAGGDYLEKIENFDVIFKTPGISLKNNKIEKSKIVSQTGIFLEIFKNQIIGVTGTKGKSTTASLIYHIIKQYTANVILTGNIGTPAFDSVSSINEKSIMVVELSSHQLEYVKHSPNIAILLNIYQEHLDHYKSYEDYQKAKLNISKFQHNSDTFIYNFDDKLISSYINELPESQKLPISISNKIENGCYAEAEQMIIHSASVQFDHKIPNTQLKGMHNHYNILAAIAACKLKNIPDEIIIKGIETYKGLEHRLEYVGKHNGIHFYNDSIATIPEATIAALRALQKVNTLILGGYDRGIDYSPLIEYLSTTNIENIILLGEAGKTIEKLLIESKFNKNIVSADSMQEVVRHAFKFTKANTICLLSPAAASYGMFKDFTDRGEKFRHLVRSFPNA